MYEPFFGFHRRPFSTAPDPGCFFAGETVQGALTELTTCVERGQGIALLTAPAGMGKSLLCQRLIANLKGRFATIYLGNANFPTRRSLLQAILLELGDEYSRSDEAELRHTLQKRLRGLRQQEALLLVVDEAHLFETELLEEIRTLADIADDGQPLVRIVLSGQLELEERLTDRRFDALNQRLGTHVFLEPLTQAESAEYLHHRIERAGGDAESVFTEQGFSIVVRASGGVPRCLNQLADHSLLLAFAADEKPVQEKTVRDALDDLKQLPLHWNDVTDTVSSSLFDADGEGDIGSEAIDPLDEDFSPGDFSRGPDEPSSAVASESSGFSFEDDTPESAFDADRLQPQYDMVVEEPAAVEHSESETVAVVPVGFESHPETPANAAALMAAAEVFDAVADEPPIVVAESDVSPEVESLFEAAWEATYDTGTPDESASFGNASAEVDLANEPVGHVDEETASTETEASVAEFVFDTASDSEADDDFADANVDLRLTNASPEITDQPAAGDDRLPGRGDEPIENQTVDAESTADNPGIGGPAVLEFGAMSSAVEDTSLSDDGDAETIEAETAAAEPATVIEHALIADHGETADVPLAAESELPSHETPGEALVETAIASATGVIEIFVVDHYSTLEEPQSADIVWPRSAFFALDRVTADDDSAADGLGAADSDKSAVAMTDCDAAFEVDAEIESPIEDLPAATSDSLDDSTDEFSAGEAWSTDDDATLDESFVEETETETADDTESVAETEHAGERESHETVFEFGIDHRSETDFELVAAAETTFEDAETLLSDFDHFATADNQETVSVREIDPARCLDSIGAMIDELDFDADDAGRVVNDQSDEPERPSLDIESDLIQSVERVDRDIEDEIGATMLDICLDTQSAVYELTRQLRESSASRDVVEEQADDGLPHLADVDPAVLDVVEPEVNLPDPRTTPQTQERIPAARTNQPPKKRAFGSLFSDLRRRRN